MNTQLEKHIRQTRLSFRSSYRGFATYDIAGGPMDGCVAKVAFNDKQFYIADWNGGIGWNISADDYGRDVIGRIGLIAVGNDAVTKDVLAAYKRLCLEDLDSAEIYSKKHSIEAMGSEYFTKARARINGVETGYWDFGWHRVEKEAVC